MLSHWPIGHRQWSKKIRVVSDCKIRFKIFGNFFNKIRHTCCCPSELTMLSSPSFLHDRVQLPTTMTSSLDLVKMGKVAAFDVTAARARWSFSRNSPRFSLESEPPSGLPLEYMVANFPSKTNLQSWEKKRFSSQPVWPDWVIFLTVLVDKFTSKHGPNIWSLFGLFWKCHF